MRRRRSGRNGGSAPRSPAARSAAQAPRSASRTSRRPCPRRRARSSCDLPDRVVGMNRAIGRVVPRVRNAPSRLPPIPVSRIGRPPGSTRASPKASAPEARATTSSTRVRTSGTRSARNASGKIRSTPSRSGSGIAAPSRKPPSVARFHVDEQAQLGAEEERERPLPGRSDDAERFVGEEERRRPGAGVGSAGSPGRATTRRGRDGR